MLERDRHDLTAAREHPARPRDALHRPVAALGEDLRSGGGDGVARRKGMPWPIPGAQGPGRIPESPARGRSLYSQDAAADALATGLKVGAADYPETGGCCDHIRIQRLPTP